MHGATDAVGLSRVALILSYSFGSQRVRPPVSSDGLQREKKDKASVEVADVRARASVLEHDEGDSGS
jgi:hypothetical protein